MKQIKKYHYLADKLHEVRSYKLLKQYEIAKYLNLKPSTYNRFEKGIHIPIYKHLKKLSEILDVSERDLKILWLSDIINNMLEQNKEISNQVKNNIKF